MEPSKAFTLNLGDFRKLGLNGLLVGLAAGLTYVGGGLADVDLGPMGLVVVPIVSILLNAAVAWANNNHVQDEPDTPV
jgi:hypothetical protein